MTPDPAERLRAAEHRWLQPIATARTCLFCPTPALRVCACGRCERCHPIVFDRVRRLPVPDDESLGA